jgi:hypothetical protein
MSTDSSGGTFRQKEALQQPNTPVDPEQTTETSESRKETPHIQADEHKKYAADAGGSPGQPSESTLPSTPDDTAAPRQVIAVSASKSPSAFFKLARKFLVANEICDLSALEGAIVTAVDAALLLERSKLATIVKYVLSARSHFCPVTSNPTNTLIAFIPQNTNIICCSRTQATAETIIGCYSGRNVEVRWNYTIVVVYASIIRYAIKIR